MELQLFAAPQNYPFPADSGSAREQTAAGGHEHRRLQEEQAVAGGPLRPIGGRQEASFLIYVPGFRVK